LKTFLNGGWNKVEFGHQIPGSILSGGFQVEC